ncbi:MAG: phospholipase D-like domain-containing protein, partial [Bacteroidia bacterium]
LFVSDEPGKNENRKNHKGGICSDSLLALIMQAKTSIDIQSSYLILTEEGKKLLKEITGKGVKIRILTNSLASTDNNEAFNGYQRDRKEILKTGIEVYEFKPNAEVRYKLMIPEAQSALSYTPVYGHHAKTMVIDGYITVIGSFNVDPRSVNLNTECVVILRNEEVAKTILKHLNEEILPGNAWHITPDFNPDPEAGRVKQIEALLRRIFPKKIL